jgi:polyphosphate kinase 2 (PPK2 family)
MARKERAPTPDEAYEFELYPPGTLTLASVDLTKRISDDDAYEEELEELQRLLFREQVAHYLQKRRAVIVFEGWDAAGKGGAIKRLTTFMDPRGYKVWPIGPPRDAEVRQHYLWRFWMRLPELGELAVFDRSWYGRVLVERVEGFAKAREWKRAYDEINAFERMLTDDGVKLCKFFLHIDRKTQLERFRSRESDPLKQYKIGPDDWRNRSKWRAYEQAVQDMLDRTHRPDGPWCVIPANDKKFARLEVLRNALAVLRSR